MFFGTSWQELLLVRAPVIIFALTVHEFFHAWTANKFGDPTAYHLGRLTLNPLAHLDVTGTLIMVVTGFQFGWAKPVPVNPVNYRFNKVADISISLAGPLSNIGQAIIAGLIYRMAHGSGLQLPPMAWTLLQFAVVVNLTLAFFNVLPIFPLDGSHVMRNLLPYEMRVRYENFNRFAPILLIVLLISGALSIIIFPPVRFFAGIIIGA